MNEIDERILSMKFDNAGFEEGVSNTIDALHKLNDSISNVGKESGKDTFETLQSSVNNLNFDNLNQAIDTLNYRFSDFGIASARIIENIADQIFDLGETIISSLTIDPVKLGWTEYNQLIDISRLMAANTSASIEEINAFSDRLNEYADKTKYNFLNMSEGAKQFVQATGSLEYTFNWSGETIDVEKLVEGATNYIALTGGSNANLSNVLEVFSRALQSGSFTKESMRRLTRNGAAGKIFENIMRQAVANVGQQSAMDAAIEKTGSFMDALDKTKAGKYAGWANADVIAEFLRIVSDTSDPIGRKAYENATEATTLQEVMDQTTEAVQSSWTRTWRSIIGDLEEAKEVWRVVNYNLNGVNGALTKYSDYIGGLAEEWKELGGRTDVINGLFDAFQGLYNIVCSIGNIFEMFFPGITAGGIKDVTSRFAEAAENFRIWTEDLRSMFGGFIGGYDFSKKEVEYVAKEAETKSLGYDEYEYYDQLDSWIDSHKDEIDNWLNQFVELPEYYDKNGNWNQEAIIKRLKYLGWENFMPGNDNKNTKKANKEAADDARAYLENLLGINQESWFRSHHYQGVMNEDHFMNNWEEHEREAYLNILRELGYDTYAYEEELKSSLEQFEEIPAEYSSYKENVQTPIVIQGLDYSDPEVREAYKEQVNFINTLSGVFSIIKGIGDAAKDIYAYLIKPLAGSVIGQIVRTVSTVLGELGRRVAEVVRIISNKSSLKELLISIYDFIATNVDLNTFFDNIINYFANLFSIIEKVIIKFVDFTDKIKKSKTFTALSNIIQNLWDKFDGIFGSFIGNKKSGMGVGGILGALTGAIKGFFTGGPIGMVIGAIKGLATGTIKGGLIGSLMDGITFLTNNGPTVIEIVKTIGGYIGGIFTSIASGFTSENNPLLILFNGIKGFFTNIKNGLSGNKNPLESFLDFLKSDTVKNFFENLKAPFVSFGEFLSDTWDFVYNNVTGFFEKMSQKWSLYMEKFNNNPFEAFINIIKDSALVTAIKTFFSIISEGFSALWSGLTGIATDNPVTNAVKGIDFKNLSLVDFISTKFQALSNALTAFKNGEQFAGIKQFFKNIGDGIRQLGTILTNGDLFGIILDFFSMIGTLAKGAFSSLVSGTASTVTSGVEKINGVFEKSPLSEKLHLLKTDFEGFLKSDSFVKLQEGLNTVSGAIGSFFISLTTGKGAGRVLDGIGKIFDFFTNESVIKFFTDLRDTIVDFFSSIVSGFTGTDINGAATSFKDKLVGIFTSLGDALKQFRESEGYQGLLDLAKTLGEGIKDKLESIIEFVTSLPEKLKTLKNPLSFLTDFFGAKDDTKDAVTSIKDGIASIGESILQTGQDTEKKTGGIFDSLLEKATGIFDIITGTATASAATIDDVQVLPVAQNVLYGRDELKTEEHTATLKGGEELIKGTTEAGKIVNEGQKEVEEADKNVKNYNSFIEKLGSAAMIIAGIGTVIAAIAGGFIFVNAISVLKGVLNVVGIINNVTGAIRANTILKYVEAVSLIVLSIAGLALVVDNLKNSSSLATALLVVSAAIIAVVLLADLFRSNSDAIQDMAAGPLQVFKAAMDALADGIKDLFSKIRIILLIAAVSAAIIAVALVLYKLATVDTAQLTKATGVFLLIVGILAAFLVGAILYAKFANSQDVNDMKSTAISIAAIGVGIYLVMKSILDIITSLNSIVNSNSFKENAFTIIIGTIAIFVVGIVALIGSIYLLQKAIPKDPSKILAIPSMISFAISILALGVSIKLITESMVSLLEAVSKLPNINAEDLVYAATAMGILIFAVGLFGAVAASKNRTITLRTSIAFVALAVAMKLLIGEFVELAKYMSTLDFSDKGFDQTVKTISSAVITMVVLMVSLAAAIWLMEKGGGKVFLRTSIALFAIVAAVGLLLLEINQVFKTIDSIKGTDEEKIDKFKTVVNQMIKLISTLALAIAVLKLKSIEIGKNGEKAKITGNSGFLAAISALILVAGAVWSLQTIVDMADSMQSDSFKAALDSFIWILVAIAGLTTVIGKFAGKIYIRTIVAMIALVASTIASIAILANIDLPADDIYELAKSVALVVASLGSMTSLLEIVSSWVGKSNKDTTFLDKLGQFVESLVTMAGIITIATIALVLASNNIEDPTGILEISEAISLFMSAMAGIAAVAAHVGMYGDLVVDGLKSILEVIGVVGGIISAVAGLYGLSDWARNADDGVLGFIGGIPADIMDTIGEGFKSFAGFLGELVAEFQSGAMVNDSKDLADMTENVSTSMATLSENLKSIDYPTIGEVEQLIEKFNSLRTSLGNYDSGGVPTNAFQLLGQDLNKFSEEFATFAEAVTGLDGEVDTELLGSVCDALQQIFNIEFPKSGTGWLSKPVDLSNMSTNIGEVGRGLNVLYSFCSGITDVSVVENVGAMITSLNSFLEEIKNYDTFTSALSTMDTILNSIAAYGTGKGVNEDQAMQKLGAVTWIMRSLASIMESAGNMQGKPNQLGDLFAGIDIGSAIDKFSADVEDAEGAGAAIDKAATSIARMFGTKEEKFRGIGAGVGAIMAAGLKSYFDSEVFEENLSYIIAGLTAGLNKKHDEIAKVGTDLATILEEAFRKVLDIESPSGVFEKFGDYIIQGLIKGIEEGEDPLLTTMANLATNLTSAFDKNLDIKDLLKENAEYIAANPLGVVKDTLPRSGLQAYMNPIDTEPGVLLGEHMDRMAKATEEQTEAIEEGTKEEKGLFETVDDFLSGALEATGLAGTPDSKIDLNEVEALYNQNVEELEKYKAFLSGATSESDKTYYQSKIDNIEGILTELESQYSGYLNHYEKQENNGWLSTLGLIDAVDSVKKAVTDNELYQMVNSLATNGFDLTDLGNTLIDTFGEVIPEKQLKRVLDGSVLQDVLEYLHIDDFGINSGIFEGLLNSANGNLEDLTNAFNLNFGTDYSEGQMSSLLGNVSTLLGQYGATDDNSNIMGLLEQFLGSSEYDFGDYDEDSFSLDNLLSGDLFSSDSLSSSLGELTSAASTLGGGTDSIAGLGDAMGEALGAVEQVDSRITDMALRVISGEFGNNPDRQNILESMGYSYGVIQNEVNRLLGCNYRYAVSNEDVQRTLEALGGTAQTTSEQIATSAELVKESTSTGQYVGRGHISKYLNETGLKAIWFDLQEAINEETSLNDNGVNLRKITRIALSTSKTYEDFISKLKENSIDISESKSEYRDLWNSWQQELLNDNNRKEEEKYIEQLKKDVEYEKEFNKLFKESHDQLNGGDFFGAADMSILFDNLESSKTYEEFLNTFLNSGWDDFVTEHAAEFWQTWESLGKSFNNNLITYDKAGNVIDDNGDVLIEYLDENEKQLKESAKRLATTAKEYSAIKEEADELINSPGTIFDSKELSTDMKRAAWRMDEGNLQGAIDKVTESYNELMDSATKNKYSLVPDSLAKDRENYTELNEMLHTYRENLKKSRTKNKKGEVELTKDMAGTILKRSINDYIMKNGGDHSAVTNSLYSVLDDIENGKFNKAVYQMQSSIGYLENSMKEETFNVAEELKKASEALDAGNTEEASQHIVAAIDDMNRTIDIYNEKVEKSKALAEAGWDTALSTTADTQINKMLREINSSMEENLSGTGISKKSKEYADMAYAVLDSTLSQMDSVSSYFDTYDEFGNIVERSVYDIDGNKIADISFKNGKLIADNIAEGYRETDSITNVVADDFVTLESLLAEKKDTIANTLEDLKDNTIKPAIGGMITDLKDFADVAFNNVIKQASSLEDVQNAVNSAISTVGADAWNFTPIREIYDNAGNLESILMQNKNTGELTSYTYENGKIVGRSYIDGAMAGSEEKGTELGNSTKNLMEEYVIGASKTALDSHSPSKVFIEIGEDCMQGLIQGMTSLSSSLNTTAQSLMQNMANAARGVSQAISVATDEDFQMSPTITPVIDSSNASEFIDRMTKDGIFSIDIVGATYFEKWMRAADDFSQRDKETDILNYITGMQEEMTSIDDSLTAIVNSNRQLHASITSINNTVADLGSQMAQMKIYLNNDVLVGQLTPGINKNLNTIQTRKGRGI